MAKVWMDEEEVHPLHKGRMSCYTLEHTSWHSPRLHLFRVASWQQEYQEQKQATKG